MDTQPESKEPERRESIGGRVRRFIDSELNRALDKKDREPDEGHTVNPGAPTPGPEEFDRPPATDRPQEDSPGTIAHPVTTPPVDAPHSSPVDEPRSSVDEPHEHGFRTIPALMRRPSAARMTAPAQKPPPTAVRNA
jgi:hypothetical protein